MRQRHFQSKNLTGASQAISHISEINTPVLSPKLAMLSLQQGGCLLPETVCQTSVAVHFEEAKQPALFFQRDLLGIKKKKVEENINRQFTKNTENKSIGNRIFCYKKVDEII